MTIREEIEEKYSDDEKLLFIDGFDDAIVGVVNGISMKHESKVCYAIEEIIAILVEEGWDYYEAVEHFEINISGSYMGVNTPCFIDIDPDIFNEIKKLRQLKAAIDL